MNNSNYRPRKRDRKPPFPYSALIIGLLAITAVFSVIWAIAFNSDSFGTEKESTQLTDSAASSYVTAGESSGDVSDTPTDELTYTETTLLVTGDVMYHSPQLEAAYNSATGEYSFSDCYKYIKSIVSAADYAVANFETTLAGDGSGYAYQGYPVFNTPDSGLSALVEAGFDMMLYANNHCYDTQHTGLIRTQEQFKSLGLDYIGARLDSSGKTYRNVTVGDVTFGMLNSTDDLSYGNTATRTLNGIALQGGDVQLIDLINHSLLEEFYASAEAHIKELRDAGADIIIYFVHWGDEYHLTHNDMQAQIAQRLCDLGVDVIIGGHPHVIQDAQLLSSTKDASHKTLCFYSLGNLISNQNRLTMGDTMNSTYTENGLIVELTVRKYSNGECVVAQVDTVPLWVHRYSDSVGRLHYEVVPVEAACADPASYGLYNSSFGVSHASAVAAMTDALLGGICETFAASVTLPQ